MTRDVDAEIAARLVRDFESSLYVPSGMDEEPEPYEQRKAHTDACRNAIITALTAAPEKPRVDVRKVMHSAPEWMRTGGKARLERDLTDMLTRAGYEVIE